MKKIVFLCVENSCRSQIADALPDVQIDKMVSMGCGDSCPTIRAKERIEWDIPDPKDMKEDEFRQVIKEIETKVLELLK